MLVNEVTIKNFKSLKDVRFNTKRVNVFIGEPNSGKSNLVEALSLLSVNTFEKDNLREIVRFENTGNLFYDNDVSQVIDIDIESLRLRIEYARGQQDSILNEFWFQFYIKDKKPYGNNEWNRRQTMDYPGESHHYEGEYFLSPFRSYYFKRLKSFKTGFAGPFLETPFGKNIPSLLLNFPAIKNLVSDFFRDKGYFLNIKPVDYSIELAKNINEVFVSYPYQTISETLQRIVFISLAIATNKDSVLIFDEPESNTFPFYTKYIAETIANDKSNQYFLTTHNPFLLMNLVEKTPANELAVFVAKNEDYQTKLYPLNEKDMEEVVNLGHDVFFNLNKFTDK